MDAVAASTTVAAVGIVAAAGGSFLLESRTPDEIFTPEDLNEEQGQIAATAEQKKAPEGTKAVVVPSKRARVIGPIDGAIDGPGGRPEGPR